MIVSSDLNQVDPQWAWSLFEPNAEQPWSRRFAAHLYRRAGFAASERQLGEAMAKEPRQLVQQLVTSMSPVVRRMAKSSHLRSELVLKRVVSDDCREEFFVTREALARVLAALPLELRDIFAPLELGPLERAGDSGSDTRPRVRVVAVPATLRRPAANGAAAGSSVMHSLNLDASEAVPCTRADRHATSAVRSVLVTATQAPRSAPDRVRPLGGHRPAFIRAGSAAPSIPGPGAREAPRLRPIGRAAFEAHSRGSGA